MRHDTRVQRFVGKLLIYSILTFVCFIALMPFIWMVRSSFMDLKQMYKMPIQWVPNPWVLDNFETAVYN